MILPGNAVYLIIVLRVLRLCCRIFMHYICFYFFPVAYRFPQYFFLIFLYQMLYLCNIAFRGVSKLLYHIIFYAWYISEKMKIHPHKLWPHIHFLFLVQILASATMVLFAGAGVTGFYLEHFCYRSCVCITAPYYGSVVLFTWSVLPRWNVKCWTVCTMGGWQMRAPACYRDFSYPVKSIFLYLSHSAPLHGTRTSNPLLIFGIRQVHRYNIFHLLFLHHVSRRYWRRSHEGAAQWEKACTHEEHIWKYKSHFRACVCNSRGKEDFYWIWWKLLARDSFPHPSICLTAIHRRRTQGIWGRIVGKKRDNLWLENIPE